MSTEFTKLDMAEDPPHGRNRQAEGKNTLQTADVMHSEYKIHFQSEEYSGVYRVMEYNKLKDQIICSVLCADEKGTILRGRTRIAGGEEPELSKTASSEQFLINHHH